MTTILQKLSKKELISPPDFVVDQTQYLVMLGSVAYGINNNTSDIDIYGFCIPDKNIIFPHLAGEIYGFGKQKQRFEQYQQHHIKDPSNNKEYDITIYNIVKYFDLCMNSNPNILDSLFVPTRCVLFTTSVGELVRENRKLFLHKGSYHKFRGYCFSQLHKAKTKEPVGKRKELIDKFGYDSKFLTHGVRLLLEIEQIMIEHDLDVERNSELLKSIRKGEWTLAQIDDWIKQKEASLEGLYASSALPHYPNEQAIKELLLHCLELHFGSLDKAIIREDRFDLLVSDLKELINKYGK